MKILVVHQYYLLPGASGGSRFNEMARLWAEAGHDVTVIAGTVNYLTGKTPELYRGRWIVQEQDGAVKVLRCHVADSYNKGYKGRTWAFVSFMLSAASAVFRIERPDVVIATSPPLTVAPVGWAAAHKFRRPVPWIFEVRDLWPESAITTGVLRANSALARCLYALEQFAYRSATRINALTPAFKEVIVQRGLAKPEKITVISNGADLDNFRPGPRDNAVRREFGWAERTVFLYAGAHGKANSLMQLIDAGERLRDRTDILIACAGDGPEREMLQAEVRIRKLQNILFCGAQPKSRMCDFVNAADAGVALLQKNPTFRTVYPNKVFDYMACERPTLLAIDGVARKLVCDEAAAGVFAEPENPDALAAAICYLADNPAIRGEMGRRGREWVHANASRTALAEQYLDVLAEVARK
jgi:glycosyltransferase involved in cell wall biosynthesis